MKSMTTFTDEDVLNNDPPSPWKKMTPSRDAMEEEEELWKAVGVWGRNKMQRSQPWGFSWTTPFLGCSKPLVTSSMMVAVTTSTPAAPSLQTIFAWVLEPQDKLMK